MTTLTFLCAHLVTSVTRAIFFKQTELSPGDESYLAQIEWLSDDASYTPPNIELELELDRDCKLIKF